MDTSSCMETYLGTSFWSRLLTGCFILPFRLGELGDSSLIDWLDPQGITSLEQWFLNVTTHPDLAISMNVSVKTIN